MFSKDAVLAMLSTGFQQKGLVGHWPLDQQSLRSATVTADVTSNANHGTLVNAPTATTDMHGQANKAISFNGTTQYVLNSTANWRSSDSAGTISAWINTNDVTNTVTIFASGDEGSSTRNLTLALNAGQLQISQRNNDTNTRVVGDTVMSTGSWHHVVVISNSDAYTMYVDNVLQNKSTPAGLDNGDWLADTDNRDNITIGTRKIDTVANYFNGAIADVRVYNRALTATQVTDLYNKYRPKTSVGSLQKGLVGHWKLDQASNKSTTVTADATPNGNDGTGAGGITIGGATDQHGQANRATTFDGVNDEVRPTLKNNIAGNLTVSAWAKTTNKTSPASQFIYGGYDTANRLYLGLESGNYSLSVGATQKSTTAATAITNGQWHHWLFSVNRTTNVGTLYIDGVSVDTLTSISGGAVKTNPDYIGTLEGVASSYWGGAISDIRVYNRALDATEVTSLYNSYRPKVAISSLYKGLVLDMPLDSKSLKDAATTVADKTPNANNGTLVGSPTFTTDRKGQANKAMSFNGTSQYVDIGNVNSHTNFSVSAWVKTNSVATNQAILQIDDMGLQILSTSVYYFSWDNRAGSGTIKNNTYSASLSASQWYHFVVTATGTTALNLYIDGASASSAFSSDTPSSNYTDDLIGVMKADPNTFDRYFNGSIANVKVWNRALSSTEVTSLYNSYR